MSGKRAFSTGNRTRSRRSGTEYTLVTPRGGNMLSAFVERPENDPFRRAQEERVSIEELGLHAAAGIETA